MNNFLRPTAKPFDSSPLFSVVESETHYIVALDLPALPSTENEITANPEEIQVRGKFDGQTQKQAMLSCILSGRGAHAFYKDGMICLSLPKTLDSTSVPA